MLAFLLVFAGLALVIGAKGVASQIVKGILGVALVLTAIPCLVQSCSCLMPGVGDTKAPSASNTFLVLLLLTALAVGGGYALRHRAEKLRSREIWARRNGSPRTRALPAPPPLHEEDNPPHDTAYSQSRPRDA